MMYFANDGGIYRALNGFTGLTTGSCTGTNLFDDLNQNLGSMTQFVSFSQHATDANTLLGERKITVLRQPRRPQRVRVGETSWVVMADTTLSIPTPATGLPPTRIPDLGR